MSERSCTDLGLCQSRRCADCPELLRGRLKFGDATNSAPFPSAVVVFRPRAFALTAWAPDAA